jgi:hypothetical protein
VGATAAPTAPPGQLLHDGDEISAGVTVLRFHDPAEEYLRALEPAQVPVPVPVPRSGVLPIVIAVAIAVAAVVALIWLLV